MSYTDYLRQQRGVYSSVWLQFSHAYQTKAADLFVFFEGHEDLAFFMPELRRSSEQAALSIKSFVCRGKRIVLKLVPTVRRRIDQPWRALFFVDKDVDDFLGTQTRKDPFIYETKCYSIENYLVSEKIFGLIWTELLRLSDSDPRLGKIEQLYKAAHKRFVRSMTPLMAWSIYHRKHGRRPNLKNLDLSKFFRVTANGLLIKEKGFLNLLDRQCGIKTPTRSWRSIKLIAQQLQKHEPKIYIRGKFELWFFVQFVKSAIQLALTIPPPKIDPRQPSKTFTLTTENAVATLSGRCLPPPEFVAFIKDVHAKIDISRFQSNNS
jgi:hypothetical protein